MRIRSVFGYVSALALAGGLGLAVTEVSATPVTATKSAATCTHAMLSPYVQSARSSAASFIADLAKYGASTSAISTIAITLANGDRVQFTFSGRHFTLSGTGVPSTCKTVTSTDDWEF